MISYAQNFEDVLLNRAFSGVDRGFYVDIGAHDPVIDSVTKHFYDRGWSGINIEPGSIFQRLVLERPRDINLNIAVTDHSGDVTLFEYPDVSGLSTLRSETPPSIRSLVSMRVPKVVRGETLTEILAAHAPDKLINFLKIDIEGHEGQVINSTNWQQFRPEIILVEATVPNTQIPSHVPWESSLLGADYRFCYFDGLNRFYVRSESARLADCFSLPVNVFDGFTKFNAAQSQRIDDLKEQRDILTQERQSLIELVEALQADNQALSEWKARVLSELRADDVPRELRFALGVARVVRRIHL
jgi:FkbM family methyltransferase